MVNDIAWEENKRIVGRRVDLLVAEGEGRKDTQTQRLSGRGPDNRLVHFTPTRPDGSLVEGIRPGDVVTVEVTYAAPHHLVADDTVIDVRRTRSGDAWDLRQGAGPTTKGVGLGMPSVGAPAPLPPAPVCG